MHRAWWRVPLLLVVVLSVLAVPLFLMAPTSDATTTTLKATVLRAQLAQKQAELKKANSRLSAIQKELDSLAQQQNDIEVRLAELEDSIAKTEQEIIDSEADLDAAREKLEERLVALYKQGSTVTWPYAEVLLGETNITELLDRFDDLSLIADEDQKLFDEVEGYLTAQQEAKRLLQEQQAEQVADLQELATVQEEASAKFSAVNAEYKALKSQASKLKTDIQKADAAAAAAAAAARRRAIARMAYLKARQWNNSGGGTIQPPPFVFPVQGANSYINSWGFARSGGRTHKGTDIMAARGTPLVACVGGTISGVSRVDTGLGGITVHVKGNNGYIYYYAHLDHVASGIYTGMTISAGTTVGYVGNTGNARNGACHLHFGMQPGGGANVNPYATLRYYDD
jgi:murein DD-endopeptidase MepM/ murein hydrolase activator NlpD